MNNLFDAMNRKSPIEGLTPSNGDFKVISMLNNKQVNNCRVILSYNKVMHMEDCAFQKYKNFIYNILFVDISFQDNALAFLK